MSSRIITVYGTTPYANVNGMLVEVPSIRIQGKWVEGLGFGIGSKIEVCEGKGEITIKLLQEKERY